MTKLLQLVPSHTLPAAPAETDIDIEILSRLNLAGPRYTSYPAADRFDSDFGFGDYLEAVAGLRTRGGRNPMALYIHVPFCESICYYCACNKIITKDRSKAVTYLTYLKQEITMQGKLFAGMNRIDQLYFGGGTPTYFSDVQMKELLAHLRYWFDLAPDADGEYVIEIDPRTVSPERVHTLRQQGFNRLSMGVQDFDPEVQKAVNRIQSEQQTVAVIEAARAAGFRSVAVDLIYGLPYQTPATMAATLDKVVAAGPDRISVYSYAHMPHLFKPQRRLPESAMPDPQARLEIMALCIRKLTAAGYTYIGMDHFAKPEDELAVAQRHGLLHRNLQGFSTRAEADLVSCGVSAISAVGATYSQNEKTLDAYYEKLDEGKLPIARGLKLGTDDLLRRIIIQMLMCNFELSIAAIEQAWPIKFADHFASELARLAPFEKDGLLTIEPDWLSVTPKGRLLVRNICMVFDRYLSPRRSAGPQPLRFSRKV